MSLWKLLKVRPWDICCAIYIICNGILTINVNSIVYDKLYHLLGFTGMLAPVIQILAGLCVIIGGIKNKSNIESFGLIVASSLFLVRAIILVTDGDVTLSDINVVIISILITLASTLRINQMLQDYTIKVTTK